MLRTPNNEAVARANLAVGRAHARIPTFDIARALDVTLRIERAIGDEQKMHVMFALSTLLLKGMGLEPEKAAAMAHER